MSQAAMVEYDAGSAFRRRTDEESQLLDRLRAWRRQRIIERRAPSQALWLEVVGSLPVLRGLEPPQQQALRDLSTLLLHKVQLVEVADVRLGERDVWSLAAQACLPILELGLDWYEACATIVVYPGNFVARHRYRDEVGLEHEDVVPLSGEAWDSGPIVLSLDDVRDAGAADGFNVVIHEFAHKLDMLNGDANGHPPLHGNMRLADWTSAFTDAYADFTARVLAGEHPDGLDTYAAESPAEFFSVASESFFEIPGRLRRLYPEVYRQLALFYRQRPDERLG
ncbi:zinc-dependent peptidase [Methylonatrum kenyense]|uniref:M90 family metallopeptidase n=1 Tax=Methylonatrum kenyense TaxID=455253 RepID=UPI0020C0C4CA|nr:M90 family metallopeptidase [Methylonatrum kenyense]MCK8515461.1 zinc-dependent peptidase [Methylonatrum kenyense]